MLDVKALLAKITSFFSDGGTIYGNVDIKHMTMDRDGGAPANDLYRNLMFRDRDGEAVGLCRGEHFSDGRTGVVLAGFGEKSDGTQVGNYLTIGVQNGAYDIVVTSPAAWCDGLGIGSIENKNISTAVTVATGTTGTSIGSLNLGKGVWLVIGYARFGSNATGRRYAKLSATSGDISQAIPLVTVNAVNGVQTNLESVTVVSPSASTTYHLNVAQTSGGNLSVAGYIRAVKIASL